MKFKTFLALLSNFFVIKIEEGIEWSQKALQRELTNPQGFQARCHLYIGIGNSILSANTIVKQDKKLYSMSAFDNFNK